MEYEDMFKFKIGDYVTVKFPDEYLVREMQTLKPDERKRARLPRSYRVIMRMIEECPGGKQISYYLRDPLELEDRLHKANEIELRGMLEGLKQRETICDSV